MSEDRTESRQGTINELTELIESRQAQLHELLRDLQWTDEDIQARTARSLKVCTVNPHHTVPTATFEKHVMECRLVQEGYSRQEQKDFRSTVFFYENSPSVVSVDKDKEWQRNILSKIPGGSVDKPAPLTVDRADGTFTSAERLALYNAIVERASISRGSLAGSESAESELNADAVAKTGEDVKRVSKLEMLALLRDYKRRRQSYRAKNVHITKRSQTEIMREVIEAQMAELQQTVQPEETTPDTRGRSPSPARSRTRAHSRSPVRSLPGRSGDRGGAEGNRCRSRRDSPDADGRSGRGSRASSLGSRSSSASGRGRRGGDPPHVKVERDVGSRGASPSGYDATAAVEQNDLDVVVRDAPRSRESSHSPRRRDRDSGHKHHHRQRKHHKKDR